MSSTSKRQRELARRRAERQAERRAQRQRQRRRRNILTTLGVFALVLLAVLGFTVVPDLFKDDKDSITAQPDGSESPTGSPSPEPEPEVACGAEKPPAPTDKQFPKEPPNTIDTKKAYTAKITTSCGVIEVEMLDDKAPRTVNSFKFLSEANFFDGTFCHRMTEGGLTVLQCGDPTGSGSGGPGYEFADENLAGATYTRGVVAMANSGPATQGSQFFFVIKDSQLGPQYTPWGKVTKGLDVLDKILALGITGGQDGPPQQRVYLEDFTVTAK